MVGGARKFLFPTFHKGRAGLRHRRTHPVRAFPAFQSARFPCVGEVTLELVGPTATDGHEVKALEVVKLTAPRVAGIGTGKGVVEKIALPFFFGPTARTGDLAHGAALIGGGAAIPIGGGSAHVDG